MTSRLNHHPGNGQTIRQLTLNDWKCVVTGEPPTPWDHWLSLAITEQSLSSALVVLTPSTAVCTLHPSVATQLHALLTSEAAGHKIS